MEGKKKTPEEIFEAVRNRVRRPGRLSMLVLENKGIIPIHGLMLIVFAIIAQQGIVYSFSYSIVHLVFGPFGCILISMNHAAGMSLIVVFSWLTNINVGLNSNLRGLLLGCGTVSLFAAIMVLIGISLAPRLTNDVVPQ
jgi:hypothetical protein